MKVTHDELTIEGERKLEKEEQKEGLHRTERTYGKFFRRIEIPEYVKAEQAVAAWRRWRSATICRPWRPSRMACSRSRCRRSRSPR